MPRVQDRSLDLLISSPARYHCTMDAPNTCIHIYIYIYIYVYIYIESNLSAAGIRLYPPTVFTTLAFVVSDISGNEHTSLTSAAITEFMADSTRERDIKKTSRTHSKKILLIHRQDVNDIVCNHATLMEQSPNVNTNEVYRFNH